MRQRQEDFSAGVDSSLQGLKQIDGNSTACGTSVAFNSDPVEIQSSASNAAPEGEN